MESDAPTPMFDEEIATGEMILNKKREIDRWSAFQFFGTRKTV